MSKQAMSKDKIICEILSYENRIGMWSIAINYLSNADYVMGYVFDENTKLWKVYQNSEKGIVLEWTFENEEDAINKLYKKVNFQYKMQTILY